MKSLFFALLLAFPALAPAADNRPLLIVVGMASEADIARGEGTHDKIVVGAMNEDALRAQLAALDPRKFRGVISFGVAGGLDRNLPVGTLVIPEHIATASARLPAAPELNQHARMALKAAGIRFSTADLAGVDNLVQGTDPERVAFQKKFGAGAVDMESHIAAEFAAKSGLPFIAIRALSDTYGDVLPPAARLQLAADGQVKMGSVLGSIFSDPSQISDLLKTGDNFNVAAATLKKARAALPDLFR